MSENEKEKNNSRTGNPVNKIMNSFRVNFIGKPFELNKLVNDYSTLLENQQEANSVIKATRVYKGWQYLGQIISFSSLLTSSYLSKRFSLSRSNQIKLVLLSFLPGGLFYFYSHFTYWNIVKDLVKTTRERENKYAHLDKTQIEDYKIFYNQSKDLHKYIQTNLGLIPSVIQVVFNN